MRAHPSGLPARRAPPWTRLSSRCGRGLVARRGACCLLCFVLPAEHTRPRPRHHWRSRCYSGGTLLCLLPVISARGSRRDGKLSRPLLMERGRCCLALLKAFPVMRLICRRRQGAGYGICSIGAPTGMAEKLCCGYSHGDDEGTLLWLFPIISTRGICSDGLISRTPFKYLGRCCLALLKVLPVMRLFCCRRQGAGYGICSIGALADFDGGADISTALSVGDKAPPTLRRKPGPGRERASPLVVPGFRFLVLNSRPLPKRATLARGESREGCARTPLWRGEFFLQSEAPQKKKRGKRPSLILSRLRRFHINPNYPRTLFLI